MNDVSDDEEDSPLPLESEASNSPVTRSARIFGIDVQKTRLRSLHPSQSQILMLCTFFVDNVDPIFKVMHVPTLKRSILDASSSLDNIIGGKSMEALLFAMYYAAVTSLTSEDCTKYFQEDRCTLLDRYRFATEVALANADILTSADMTTLQALVIFLVSMFPTQQTNERQRIELFLGIRFLSYYVITPQLQMLKLVIQICVRCHDDSQFSWTLIGVAIRIAYSLNLHREDIDTSLPPFALELRRRLWWQVCVLDIHASEDRGSDPMIHDFNFNTKMPLNINDADLDPESLQPLSDKACYTEMTFCRVGHDLSQLARRFNYLPPSEGNPQLSSKKITIEEKISVLKKRQEHIEKHYLAHCDLGYPLAWVATQIARLILSRMWLAIYHPLQPEYRSHAYPLTTRDDLLAISTNILELANSLEQEPTTAHWRWFFRSWVQWHALAVALAELCNQNEGTLVEKAWAIIDIIYEPWAAHIADSRNGMLWRPIQKLRSKAQANRQARSLISNVGNPRSTTTESMIFPSQQQLSYGNLQPSTFIPLSSETDLETERMLQAMMMQHQIGHHAQQQQQQDLLPPYPPQHPLFSSPLQSLPDYTTPPNPLPDFTTPQQTLPLFSSALGVVDQNMDTANWAQWDEFIQDFEMESRPGQRNPVQPLAEPFGSLWLP